MGPSLTCVGARLRALWALVWRALLTVTQGIEQSAKRHRSGVFFYQRRGPDDVERQLDHQRRLAAARARPVVHASQPGQENAPLQTVKEATGVVPAPDIVPAPPADPSVAAKAPDDGAGEPGKKPPAAATEQRRFHLSRPAAPSPGPAAVLRGSINKRSRYGAPAVFVERSARRQKAQKLGGRVAGAVAREDARPAGPSAAAADATETPPVRLPLRPGTKRAPAPPAAPRLPPSLLDRGDADMDRLTREMNEYTLQTIGHNLARLEEEKRRDAAARPPQAPMRLKPKAPALRYAERHPEPPPPDVDMSDDDEGMSDADYVTETYVRMAGPGLDASVSPDKVGLLVLDTEPDVEFFYGNEDSDSDQGYSDDEDENGTCAPCSFPTPPCPLSPFPQTADAGPAENYYTADYPDDEVASDDEYGVDPYRFALDLDEFEADDAQHSGDDAAVGGTGRGFRVTIGGETVRDPFRDGP